MSLEFFIPTRVFIGKNCIFENCNIFKSIGKRALLVTGRNSAKVNGSQEDIIKSLKKNKIDYYIFDQIEANPSIETVRKGAVAACEERVDFIIGVGGGSPLDAAKAIAILASNNISNSDLFSGKYKKSVLPIVAVPTTAGTGSEVTPYSILTDNSIKNKRSISSEFIFPMFAFLDARYLQDLPEKVSINTAIDALSHAIEGFLSRKATRTSNILALNSMEIIGKSLMNLKTQKNNFEMHENLLYASMLAGMVISHTGSTALHAMGYQLTYHKNIDHGRANGLLMYEYLKFVSVKSEGKIKQIIRSLSLYRLEDLKQILEELLGEKEILSCEEIELFSSVSINTGNVLNTIRLPNIGDMKNIFYKSFQE